MVILRFRKLILHNKFINKMWTTEKIKKILQFALNKTFSQIISWSFWMIGLNHYSPLLLFYTRWKHHKTSRFSDVFRGYRKRTTGCNGLKHGQSSSWELHLSSWFNPIVQKVGSLVKVLQLTSTHHMTHVNNIH